MGFIPVLQLLFIALKLMGYIAWPWLWVMSPFIVAAAIAVAVVIGVLGFALLKDITRIRRRRRMVGLGDRDAILDRLRPGAHVRSHR